MLFSSAVVILAAIALGAGASPADLEKRSVSSAVYDDLVYYFQYASSSYSTLGCTNPNGNTLVKTVGSISIFIAIILIKHL